MTSKDWSKICSELESPPDSDAEDEVNVQSVAKNARKVSDILHHIIPSLDASNASGLPKGVNNLSSFAASFTEAATRAARVEQHADRQSKRSPSSEGAEESVKGVAADVAGEGPGAQSVSESE